MSRIAARIERVSNIVGIAGKASSRVLRRATALLEWVIERLMQLRRRSAEAQETQNMTCPHVENGMHIQITTPHPFDDSSEERRLTPNNLIHLRLAPPANGLLKKA
ncbi:hypothetical protein ACVMB2_003923 [Sinorhizobium meliloti]